MKSVKKPWGPGEWLVVGGGKATCVVVYAVNWDDETMLWWRYAGEPKMHRVQDAAPCDPHSEWLFLGDNTGPACS